MRSIALTKLASAKRDTFEHLTSTRGLMKFPPALTPGQAIALRMDGIARRHKKDRATRYICLRLTLAEAEGLEALAGEGKAGLLTDAEAAKAYIGDGHKQNAANRAYEKLTEATSKARESR